MIESRARDALQVVLHGELVPGVIAYGLRPNGSPIPATLPQVMVELDREPVSHVLWGEAWEVLLWELPIARWCSSAELNGVLAVVLAELIGAGSRVAWIGAEGLPFSDPPDLFDPACMPGAVLAWELDNGESDVRLDLDAPLDPASGDVMVRLRSHAAGLADVK